MRVGGKRVIDLPSSFPVPFLASFVGSTHERTGLEGAPGCEVTRAGYAAPVYLVIFSWQKPGLKVESGGTRTTNKKEEIPQPKHDVRTKQNCGIVRPTTHTEKDKRAVGWLLEIAVEWALVLGHEVFREDHNPVGQIPDRDGDDREKRNEKAAHTQERGTALSRTSSHGDTQGDLSDDEHAESSAAHCDEGRSQTHPAIVEHTSTGPSNKEEKQESRDLGFVVAFCAAFAVFVHRAGARVGPVTGGVGNVLYEG